MPLQARIDVLERENDELREALEILKNDFRVTDWTPSPELMLTGREANLCRVFLKLPMATKEQLYQHLYSLELAAVEIKIIDVFVCKLRKKLKPFEIKIITIWGSGYAMNEEDRKKLKSMSYEAMMEAS